MFVFLQVLLPSINVLDFLEGFSQNVRRRKVMRLLSFHENHQLPSHDWESFPRFSFGGCLLFSSLSLRLPKAVHILVIPFSFPWSFVPSRKKVAKTLKLISKLCFLIKVFMVKSLCFKIDILLENWVCRWKIFPPLYANSSWVVCKLNFWKKVTLDRNKVKFNFHSYLMVESLTLIGAGESVGGIVSDQITLRSPLRLGSKEKDLSHLCVRHFCSWLLWDFGGRCHDEMQVVARAIASEISHAKASN